MEGTMDSDIEQENMKVGSSSALSQPLQLHLQFTNAMARQVGQILAPPPELRHFHAFHFT
jgi:hypothetical protein